MAPLDFNAPTKEEAAEIRRRKAAIAQRIRKRGARRARHRQAAEAGRAHPGHRGARHRQEPDLRRDHRRAAAPDLSIWWLVPSLEKADEQAGEYSRLRTTDSLLARVVRGRARSIRAPTMPMPCVPGISW